MNCPRCKEHALQDHVIEEWTPKVCSQCGGLWLDVKAFRETIQRDPPRDAGGEETEGIRPAVWEESPLGCPACKLTMKKGQYAYSSGVIIDRCESCHGIWLDRGELAKLRLFVNRPVPREKVLIAQMQAEGQRKRIEARLRREEFRHGWGGGGVERTQFDWKALFSFLRGIL